jgi:hypothetical protein
MPPLWRDALELFGSAACEKGFDPSRSDADFLATFEPVRRNDLATFPDLKDARWSTFSGARSTSSNVRP